MSDETVQESHAKKIQEYLRKDIRHNPLSIPRPFFVEISGTPSSGKTTTITKLDTFFRRMGFRILCPQEGAQVVRHVDRGTPLYSIRTALYTLLYLIDLSQGHLYDIVIFDRCVFDDYVWLKWRKARNQVTTEEEQTIQRFLLLRFWTHCLDAVFFMICDPEVALAREFRIGITKKIGKTATLENIAELIKYYKETYKELKAIHPQLVIQDTTHQSEEVMVHEIGTSLLRSFVEKTA